MSRNSWGDKTYLDGSVIDRERKLERESSKKSKNVRPIDDDACVVGDLLKLVKL